MSFFIRLLPILLLVSACGSGTTPQHSSRVQSDFSEKFDYISKDARLKAVENFYWTTDFRYGALLIKERLLNFSLKDLRDEAIAEEEAIANIEDRLAQAKSNLDFRDRMRKRIAFFQDTHFQAQSADLYVTNSMKFKRFGSDYRLIGLDTGMQTSWKTMEATKNTDSLKAGLRLKSVDGQAVESAVQQLAEFVAGSSKDFRLDKATIHLGIRDFSYPSSPTSTWIFTDDQGKEIEVVVPWALLDIQGRAPDTTFFLGSQGIQVLPYEKHIDTAAQLQRTVEIDSRILLSGENRYHRANDPEKVEVLRTGFWTKTDKTYAVVVLKTLRDHPLKNKSTPEDAPAEDLLLILQAFLTQAQNSRTPVILDVRDNPGGVLTAPTGVFRLLSSLDPAQTPLSTLAFRITPEIEGMVRKIPHVLRANLFADSSIWLPQYSNRIEQAVTQGRSHTFIDNYGLFIPREYHFDQDLVVLLSPTCISACDMLVSLFDYYKVGTLVGSHSNGTGASDGRSWMNPAFLLPVAIPELTFGLPFTTEDTDEAVFASNLENKPTFASHPFAETYEIFADPQHDRWFEEAHSILSNLAQP